MPVNRISVQIAEKIASANYNLQGSAHALPGEIDFNFLFKTETRKYILKISPPNSSPDTLNFQN